MILIIGGNSQGKMACAKSLLSIRDTDVADGNVCSLEQAFQYRVLNHFHLLVKRLSEAGIDPQSYVMNSLNANPDIVIISDELSSAVVPIAREDRELQESIGRILCSLAQKAEKVYRVYCGIPVCIKGDDDGI